MRYLTVVFVLSAIFTVASSRVRANEVLLLVNNVPSSGIVASRVDLTGAVRLCGAGPVAPQGVRAVYATDGKPVPLQFVPDVNFDPQNHITGTMILRLSPGVDARLRLKFEKIASEKEKPWDGTVSTPSFTIVHDPKRMGGLPTRITFTATGKVFESLRWNDRVYHRKMGSFNLSGDRNANVELVSKGPLATVVRVRCRYVQSNGKTPPSQPEATYNWWYFHDLPLVFVTAVIEQREPFTWHETHFLELTFPGRDFPRWAGGDPLDQGEFTEAKKTLRFPRWGALVDGRNAVAMFCCGDAMFYDSPNAHGKYLQAHGDSAWNDWIETRLERSAWLWIGSDDRPIEAVQAAVKRLPNDTCIVATSDKVRSGIEAARKKVAGFKSEDRRSAWWRIAGAERLEAGGHLEESLQMAAGQRPADLTVLTAGELGMILRRTGDGVCLLSLFDSAVGRELLAPQAPPLFAVTMRHVETKQKVRLIADTGWNQTEIRLPDGEKEGIDIHWQRPRDERLRDVTVVARVRPDHNAGALRWMLDVENNNSQWSVRRVVFPQVALAEPGPQAEVFLPHAAGRVQRGAWQRRFRWRGTYPNGWISMQFMAAYDRDCKTGLYVAVHDPFGGTKDICAKSRPSNQAVMLEFDHPAADMDKAGNDFALSGEAVWQLLRGDWFDAAIVYRNWVRKHARWYPKLTSEGRADTPKWMRELCVWALCSGTPEACVASVQEFAKFMGVPVGFHWYRWHQIPFDNDYPHYFPTKKGFAEAVARLQKSGVFVMPYINGRLWDTHDKGVEDFEFTRTALAAATKNENGEPYLESYNSKESDGNMVKLAAMCPTTELWQKTVRDIVLRLMNECGVKGVYIDQIAAAKPQLCFDRSHGHPTGGGHWWTESGYWPMMEKIRKAMPKDRMLTTECNAEPYVKWFDGYLTWHWQHEGQVPAFPAVYGGAIQMFGRAYRGGPTKGLALRMKAGQQLVFGEQIGWIYPNIIREKENAEFLRQVVRMRWQLRRYFYAGEMARPPKLQGEIPTVRADWQWHGKWPVSTDAVMTGAWRLPNENRLVLLFVNVSDKPVSARLEVDARAYGLPGKNVRVVKITSDGPSESFNASTVFHRDLTFAPNTAWAWELKPGQ